MHKECLSGEDGVHTRLELGQYTFQHLIDVSWMEKALRCFSNAEVHRCEIDGVPGKLVWVRKELII